MKLNLKIGDEVRVTVGKFAGKTDVVDFIDKKTKRIRLKSLKKFKDQGKKEHHGTFALSSLLSLKPTAPADKAATPTDVTTDKTAATPKAEAKNEAPKPQADVQPKDAAEKKE